MTTMEAFREELARIRSRPARASARRPVLQVLAVAAARLVAAVPRARTALLSVGGLGCLVAAAFTVSAGAGLAAGGVALLVVEWLANDDRSGR